LWIKNGPTYGIDSNEIIEQFVYKYVTFNNSLFFLNLKDSQMHKHGQTCKKKNQVVCQFHYPLPPMPCITILEPLKETLSSYQKKKLSNIANRIFENLNNVKQLLSLYFRFYKVIMLEAQMLLVKGRMQV